MRCGLMKQDVPPYAVLIVKREDIIRKGVQEDDDSFWVCTIYLQDTWEGGICLILNSTEL